MALTLRLNARGHGQPFKCPQGPLAWRFWVLAVAGTAREVKDPCPDPQRILGCMQLGSAAFPNAVVIRGMWKPLPEAGLGSWGDGTRNLMAPRFQIFRFFFSSEVPVGSWQMWCLSPGQYFHRTSHPDFALY